MLSYNSAISAVREIWGMEIITGSKKRHCLVTFSILLVTVVLIAVISGCTDHPTPPCGSQNLEIRTWYDLAAVRDNLCGNHTLMNDLNSTTLGYEDLASPTANGGKGWDPIGAPYREYIYAGLGGTFDGQGYEVRDLFINRPDEGYVGLFGVVDKEGVIKNIGVVNASVTGGGSVGTLVGAGIGTVSNSYSTGNVNAVANIGGLVGTNAIISGYSTVYGTVSNSYSSTNVTGEYGVGGLVGYNRGTVSDSYATGNVTGDDVVGGLVGRNYGSDGTVSNSYSTGSVVGNSSVGGLVGENQMNGVLSTSFWDVKTSGQATSDGGTGMTTAEMHDIATFSGAGWNIISVALNQTDPAYIWNIVHNITYPFLGWQS
jgi:hypothetical protein